MVGHGQYDVRFTGEGFHVQAVTPPEYSGSGLANRNFLTSISGLVFLLLIRHLL